jgi:hypothetical protein
MGFLTAEGLEGIKQFKYVSGGYSNLDNLMNPFWEWTVKQFPMVLTHLLDFL